MIWWLLACASENVKTKSVVASEEAVERGPCNPVDDGHCLLPFPSDFYRQNDRLSLPEEFMPTNIDKIPFATQYLHEKDGFSLGTPIYASLPGATMQGVVQWPELTDYAATDARTIMVDLSTGLRVPHHVEREEQAALDEQTDLLIIRPMIPLQYGHQYVIGVRHLVDATGERLPPLAGFAALRDGQATDPDLARQQEHYAEVIFPTLEQHGFSASELQLAWSFTTATEDNTLARIRWMKEDTLQRIDQSGVGYRLDEVVPEDCSSERRGRVINGHFSVPLYLENWLPGSVLTRDAAGMPYYNGEVEVPFIATVACSLIEQQQAGRLVQYGHGVMGTRGEANSGYIHQLADEYGWVVFAADWTGLKQQDAADIGIALIVDPASLVSVAERTQQGWIEGLTLTKLMQQDNFRQEEAFRAQNTALIDAEKLYFYGNSAGSILGSGYTTMHGGFERAVLGVGGMPFSMILTRAEGFEPMLALLRPMYRDWEDISLLLALIQQTWDAAEGIGWSHLDSPQVLVHLAVGDAGVPRMAGHVMARRYDAVLLEPANQDIWGLESALGPLQGNVVSEWYFGEQDAEGPYPAQPVGSDPHDLLRGQESGKRQLGEFINSGLVTHYCSGPCDPD